MLFFKPQLVAEFRYKRKTGEYWGYVKHERHDRSLYGRGIPYQCLTHFSLRVNSRRAEWVSFHRLWACVEIPPYFSYVWRDMMETDDSGWWVVAFTEMICKTASFILQDVYDSYRLWALSPTTIR